MRLKVDQAFFEVVQEEYDEWANWIHDTQCTSVLVRFQDSVPSPHDFLRWQMLAVEHKGMVLCFHVFTQDWKKQQEQYTIALGTEVEAGNNDAPDVEEG